MALNWNDLWNSFKVLMMYWCHLYPKWILSQGGQTRDERGRATLRQNCWRVILASIFTKCLCIICVHRSAPARRLQLQASLTRGTKGPTWFFRLWKRICEILSRISKIFSASLNEPTCPKANKLFPKRPRRDSHVSSALAMTILCAMRKNWGKLT